MVVAPPTARRRERKLYEVDPNLGLTRRRRRSGYDGRDRTDLPIRERDGCLSRVEDRVADITLEIDALRDEARSQFAAALLEREFEEAQQSNNDHWLASQTTGHSGSPARRDRGLA